MARKTNPNKEQAIATLHHLLVIITDDVDSMEEDGYHDFSARLRAIRNEIYRAMELLKKGG